MIEDFLLAFLGAIKNTEGSVIGPLNVSDKAWIECDLEHGCSMRITNPTKFYYDSEGHYIIDNGLGISHIFPTTSLRWRNKETGQIVGFGPMGFGKPISVSLGGPLDAR